MAIPITSSLPWPCSRTWCRRARSPPRRSGSASPNRRCPSASRRCLAEERLGVRLLTRSTRKLSLTTDGLHFYEHCAALLSTMAAAEEAMSRPARLPRAPCASTRR